VSEDQRIPYFGRLSVFDMMSCAFWQPKDDDRYTGPWNRRTSAEILIINNRYDPSTPLHGARDGAAELARARVFVTEGYGHTSMLAPSTCTEQVKRDYLVSGTFPAPGVRLITSERSTRRWRPAPRRPRWRRAGRSAPAGRPVRPHLQARQSLRH
jgi:hypothetical protein